jgi:hypothetical protein
MTRRNISPTGIGWKRYTPEDFGLSFDLPGEPFERPYPVPAGLQSQILESKVLDYLKDGLSVNVAHIVFSKRADLKWIAEQMKQSIYHSDSFQSPKISFVPKGDRFLVRGTFVRFGGEIEMRGLILGAGNEAWFLSVQTGQDKREGTAVCSRILESVTISR